MDFLLKHLKEATSTQIEAKAGIDRGEYGVGSVIYTSKQTQGVGRYSKSWICNYGDLAVTFVLKPNSPEYAQLSYLAAIAVGETIFTYKPALNVQYKWVNDVMVDGKKLTGILLEKYKNDLLLLGIGINILPKNSLDQISAVGLSELDINTNYESLLKVLLKQFSSLYNLWETFGFASIRNMWLEKSLRLNQEVKINLPGGIIKEGVFRTITLDGRMVLEKTNGDTEMISAGETFF